MWSESLSRRSRTSVCSPLAQCMLACLQWTWAVSQRLLTWSSRSRRSSSAAPGARLGGCSQASGLCGTPPATQETILYLNSDYALRCRRERSGPLIQLSQEIIASMQHQPGLIASSSYPTASPSKLHSIIADRSAGSTAMSCHGGGHKI